MNTKDLKKKYFEFFIKKGHAQISSAPLIPEHDPTVLFTTAGMHPLVPYLMGQKHPKGNRLVDVQKCIRTGDIDEVGDDTHLTFFEMLGNWSLGDYFKKEAIEWSHEFLTSVLGFNPEKLSVTCFEGDKDAPKDEFSASVWKDLGIQKIYFLPKEDNWWGPAGQTGPCGPDTEMFIDTGRKKCREDCKPGCSCGKYFEIWNDVFMEYNKQKDGSYTKLDQQNVDTGMGVERTIAMMNGFESVYEVDTLKPIYQKIKDIAKVAEEDEKQRRSLRVITDHLRAATFILGDERGVVPSNIDQGYILRRFIRRSIRHGKLLGIDGFFCAAIAEVVVDLFKEDYPTLQAKRKLILEELQQEEERFNRTITNGLKEFDRIAKDHQISGKDAFLLFQSFGFPLEMTEEIANERGLSVDHASFEKEFQKHQELSRVGAEKRFKGGLADHSKDTVKLHTATHLLNEAIRKVLKDDTIKQKGSNITPERLRFDFNFPRKLTPEEVKAIEELVNQKIREGIPIKREEMSFKQAKDKHAQAEFDAKYDEIVSVYSIGDFSFEVCGGPHVNNTSELGSFKITKESSAAAGIRRIKAVVK